MKEQLSFLLVDDDRVDVMTVQRALRSIQTLDRLETASDGEAALARLRDAGHALPDVILLDLNMPKMGGLEFLQVVKQDLRLKVIPVIVLTTSREEQDRMESFRLGVAGYMLKPVDFPQFIQTMNTIYQYWSLSELAK
jgi:CheY-like chemotaxis protein